MEVGYIPKVAIVMAKINGAWKMDVATPNITPLDIQYRKQRSSSCWFHGNMPHVWEWGCIN
jgi:hypothetical protein